jgi:uncharacterized radical SAM superfamily Fe-S cluster-containing enzyme
MTSERGSPVQRQLELPWPGEWTCGHCGGTTPGCLLHGSASDTIFLEHDCPTCGIWREPHADALSRHPPAAPQRLLPRMLETLCPECACPLLGRSYERHGAVWMEKTCPEHGYFRDKLSSDARLYLLCERRGLPDTDRDDRPAVPRGSACRVEVASSSAAGQPVPVSFAEVLRRLGALRTQQPVPPAAIQLTGGEPTEHPDFFRIVGTARSMGFTHVQCVTSGASLAEPGIADLAAASGLQAVHLQFDSLSDVVYRRLRGAALLKIKHAAIEACRRAGIRVCLVPTIVKGVNDGEVGEIFHFAVANADVIDAVAYQPISFSGRVSGSDREARRYTPGDLAAAFAEAGADYEDFFPARVLTPLSGFLQVLEGKPTIWTSGETEGGIGTWFFITPDGKALPIPRLFDIVRLSSGLNELAAEIEVRGEPPTHWDRARAAGMLLRSYRWRNRRRRTRSFGLVLRALRSGECRTILVGGMQPMDRYNYDAERARRCAVPEETWAARRF